MKNIVILPIVLLLNLLSSCTEDPIIGSDDLTSEFRNVASFTKFSSEGVFEVAKPLYHLKDSSKTDESTDAYDTVDWLIKNISNKPSLS